MNHLSRTAVRCAVLAAVGSGIVAASGASMSDEPALLERMRAAQQESSLDAEGLRPWHLLISVEQFDSKGALLEQGTIEEFWADPKSYRVEYKFPSYTAEELMTGSGILRTKNAASPPARLGEVLEQVVHPMAGDSELTGTRPDLRKLSFGKVPLECIMLDQPIKGVAFPPLGLFPTYCFDPGSTSLRLSYDFGSEAILRNKVGRFQNRSVATVLQLQDGALKIASASVAKLETWQVDEAKLQPSADLDTKPAVVARVAASVLAGQIIKKVPPVYPQSAKERLVSGTVVLRAIVGRDGRVRSLRPISVPDPDLAISALAAVRQWVYTPYLLNGEPTEVDTTITVNFAFGPG